MLPPQLSVSGGYGKDEILASMALPTLDELLGRHNADATAIENTTANKFYALPALRIALADINRFIQKEQYQEARERYYKLRDACLACALPESLEILVLQHYDKTSSTAKNNSS
jgi:hypothetical protein